MRYGLFVAPFGELSDPRLVAGLAAEAEAAGFDGFFLWDHVLYPAPVERIADPWVTLAAVACATERVRLGPMVTPLARRRPHKLARETVTLDHLSGGRVVLGVGLGSTRTGEFAAFGDPVSPRERAARLDAGLEALERYWAGDEVGDTGRPFLPRPAQQPRIPVWVASVWPHQAPLTRAARWDGWFPIGLEHPDQLAAQLAAVQELRASDRAALDVAVQSAPDQDPRPWAGAGATWWLIDFGAEPTAAGVRAAIAAGPPGS